MAENPRIEIVHKLNNLSATIAVTVDTINKLENQVEFICVVAALGVQLKIYAKEMQEAALVVKGEAEGSL